ncbi:MAG: Ldh family oxidoreductase [Candidatus Aminicenantes bacterium]|nr:MAG: Ldh family oxidoreductase [Candidatus Aminicenantes bacterium]
MYPIVSFSTMPKTKYKPDVIKNYVSEILKGNGVPARKAEITSNVLVEADMRGIFSHGVNSLDLMVIRSIKDGGTDPNAALEDKTRNKRFPIRHFDAQGALAHPAAIEIVDLVKELARQYGFGKVYVFNTNHFGAAAIYSERICAEKDLAGRVTCTTPAIVKPYGGKRNRLGTNLISWSIPYHKGIITIDMATTIHATSGILKTLVEGTKFPFPVYDKNGKETTNSARFNNLDDFLEKGSMIPLGGLGKGEADAGYKGTGLSLLIELDSVIGGGFSSYINPLIHDKRRRIKQAFEAWRIDTLFPQEEALEHISRTISDIRDKQGRTMLLPGEKEAKQRKRSLREGIPYTSRQIERLEKLGKEVGLGKIIF